MTVPFSDNAMRKVLLALSDCEEALLKTRNAIDPHSIFAEWDRFLLTAGRVIHSIEGECSRDTRARQWYGGERRQARADPFLQYMYQARNIVEHQPHSDNALISGINATLKNIKFKNEGPEPLALVGSNGLVDFKENGVSFNQALLSSLESGGSIEIEPGGRPRLSSFITDEKHKVSFALPGRYKGKRLDPYDIPKVGDIYLNYLRELIGRIPL